MPGSFSDKVVIVTGSSQGIGRETARMFVEQGAKITITGRNEQALAETKAILLKAGAKPEGILVVTGDLLDAATHKKIIDETVKKFGKLDILVNNAGAAGQGGNKSSFDGSVEDFDFIINLNLRSVLAMTKLAVPHLEKTQGSVVNVSSIASTENSLHFPYYSVAKAGLDHLTRSMAMAFIEKGIRVNCVNPGLTRTKFLDRIGMPQDSEDKMVELMCSDRTQMPIGRAAHPKEVGELILFLADRAKSEYIIGQCIIIDGGRSLTRPVVKELLPPAK